MSENHAKPSRILLVEDEFIIQKLCQRILVPAGYQLTVASGVGEAKAALKKGCPDLLITDIKLPDGSGFDIVREFNKDCKDKPVVIITGSLNAEQLEEEIKTMSVTDFLLKPFQVEDFLKVVKKALPR